MKSLDYLLSKNFLTVFVEKRSRSINKNDNRFSKAVELIKAKDWQGVLDILDQPAAIAKYTGGRITVFDNEVHYDGKPIDGVPVKKVLEFVKEGLPLGPLVAFLNNIFDEACDVDIREKLYTFLENNNLAITERGSFLAFKYVNSDGSSPYHSGHIQNEAGEWIPSNYKVNETYLYERSRIRKTNGECSTEGIYVGNKNYWGNAFNDKDEWTGGGRMLVAEIYPQDVVNVPHADATKIVVCKMKVVEEYATIKDKIVKTLWEETERKPVSMKPVAKRDSFGRFVGKNTKATKTKNNSLKRDKFGRFTSKVAFKRNTKGQFIGRS